LETIAKTISASLYLNRLVAEKQIAPRSFSGFFEISPSAVATERTKGHLACSLLIARR
jgi:hypothetical protein